MFTENLPSKTKKLLDQIAGKKWLKDFYLAGDTALALHYGHHQSVDLDCPVGKIIGIIFLAEIKCFS